MSDHFETPAGVALHLTARLQDVAEALAAAGTGEQVFGVVLPAALEALGAQGGAVLLLQAGGEALERASQLGELQENQTLWPALPPGGHSPAGDALLRREALYFEHPAGLLQAYPEREARSGAAATAALPMLLDGKPLGVLVVEFREPHPFTPEERRFLRILAAQCAVALGRTQLTGCLDDQVQQRTAALEQEMRAHAAFIEFTQAVGSQTDVLDLARQAFSVMGLRFQHFSSGYYVLEDNLWKLRAHTDDLYANPKLLGVLRAGLPRETPSLLRMIEDQVEVFTDTEELERDEIEHTEAYGTGGSYPLVLNGEVRAFLGFALKDQRSWPERDRALVRAVGRGLQLALERSDTARSLQEQNAELAAQTRALEGFAQLSLDFALETDPYTLVRRAQEILLSLLPSGYAVYYEPDGERWRLKAQVGNIGSSALQEVVDAGLPFTAPSVLTPWTTLAPLYQDAYAKGADTATDVVQHISSVATLPVLVRGVPVGVLGVGLFQAKAWTATDRVVLETAIRNLGLALERAQSVAQLAAERGKLMEANEELEAFAYSVSHDLRTPVRHIKGFNGLLRQAVGTPLSAKATRYLGIVDEAAGRMDALIDAMLELSRTSRQPLLMGPVNLETLVAATCLEVEADAQGRDVVWALQPLPLVMGDQATLRQVIINLLSNALKYSRSAAQAVIEVWAEERPEEWAVFVRDNGVGFDPLYADKLFGVFQRLHRHEEFEGTGVGLANVRRIITRHGGTVFAHSGPGPGATFGFTLPRSP